MSEPEHMYRSIFENAIEGIFQTTPSGQYLNVNPALAKMYGYDSTDDLIAGLTAIDNQLYVDPNRRGEFVKLMREKGVVRSFESEIYCKDKSTIWISENARAVRDETGTVVYYEGMVEDITDRKQLEKQLQSSQQNLSALINNIEDAIWSVDANYRLIIFNATFSRYFEEYFRREAQAGRCHRRSPSRRMARRRHRAVRPGAGRGKIHRRAALRIFAGGAILRNFVQPDLDGRARQRRHRFQQGHHGAAPGQHRS